ncbi:MAG: transcription termination factor Rho [Jatrophihabitans sp.]|uniref:transcription termination factor Rho n=1 Tax=Jatrophihabitans sp. TaxID=1932789 RepID=UPI003F7F570C
MTDTNEQTLPAVAEAPSDTGSAGGRTRPAARKGSLNSLLLPELQQIAGGLGLPTKMKKSDLIKAIQDARAAGSSAGSGAPRESAPSSNGGAPSAGAADSSAERAPQVARTDQHDRGDRADRADRTRGEVPAAEVSSDRGGEPGTERRRERRPDRTRDDRPRDEHRGDGASTDLAPAADAGDGGERPHQQQGGQPNRRQRNERRDGGPNRSQQGGDGHQGGGRPTNQGNASNQGNGGQGNGGQGNGSQSNGSQGNADGQRAASGEQGQGGAGDDEEFGSRRGRRYRDRRGRNRDRQGTGSFGGNADVEPTVTDDDVLIPVAGILDSVEEKNTWFVRTSGYFATSDDVYVANSYVRRFNLRRGDAITGAVKQARDGERREKYNPLVRLDTVNGRDPETLKNRVEFTKLTPLYPQERLRLETEPHVFTTRVIDLVMPIGKGQRALIVSPPKAGKTSVLQAIANAIATNNPECHLMVVLVDERPEEVTDMQRSVKGEVIASTFDRKPQDHTMVAELSIERAKRLVEMGHDVVVLLDSITRLGRAYNLAAPASGRILSGGVDSTALYPPKRFLGAARNIENGGSLTILATALVETGSTMDTVIFEEFKGTGNAELRLRRDIADKRIFPAVDVDQSSTRKEEILLSPDELAVTIKLRRVLHALEPQQAIDLLLDRLRKTRTNLEFLMQIAKTTPGQE